MFSSLKPGHANIIYTLKKTSNGVKDTVVLEIKLIFVYTGKSPMLL